jgi:hypothetical protein
MSSRKIFAQVENILEPIEIYFEAIDGQAICSLLP